MNTTNYEKNEHNFFINNILPSLISAFLILGIVVFVYYNKQNCDPTNLSDKDYQALFGKSFNNRNQFQPIEKELENF